MDTTSDKGGGEGEPKRSTANSSNDGLLGGADERLPEHGYWVSTIPQIRHGGSETHLARREVDLLLRKEEERSLQDTAWSACSFFL